MPAERRVDGVDAADGVADARLAVGRSEEDSAATGTVLRTSVLERYAQEAGLSAVEVLAIDHDMFRFYRVHP